MTIQAGPLLASLIEIAESAPGSAGPMDYSALVPAVLGFLLALLLSRPRG